MKIRHCLKIESSFSIKLTWYTFLKKEKKIWVLVILLILSENERFLILRSCLLIKCHLSNQNTLSYCAHYVYCLAHNRMLPWRSIWHLKPDFEEWATQVLTSRKKTKTRNFISFASSAYGEWVIYSRINIWHVPKGYTITENEYGNPSK